MTHSDFLNGEALRDFWQLKVGKPCEARAGTAASSGWRRKNLCDSGGAVLNSLTPTLGLTECAS